MQQLGESVLPQVCFDHDGTAHLKLRYWSPKMVLVLQGWNARVQQLGESVLPQACFDHDDTAPLKLEYWSPTLISIYQGCLFCFLKGVSSDKLTQAHCREQVQGFYRWLTAFIPWEEGVQQVVRECRGHDGEHCRCSNYSRHPNIQEGCKRTKRCVDVGIVSARFNDHRAKFDVTKRSDN